MIGTFIDTNTAETALISTHPSLVLKTLPHQNASSNCLSLKKGLVVLWSSKKFSTKQQHCNKGTVHILHLRTQRFLKRFQINSFITNIVQSHTDDELIILTEDGFRKCNCSNGFSLSHLQKFPKIHSVLPLTQSKSLLLCKTEPYFSITQYGLRNSQETLLLDYGSPGELISHPLLIEGHSLVVCMLEIEDADSSSSRIRFNRRQSNVHILAFNYSTKKIVHDYIQKFPGITFTRLNRYYPQDNSFLMEYTRSAEGTRFLSLWNIGNKGLVEAKKISLDYYATSGPRTLFLTASRENEKIHILFETMKRKRFQENIECECSVTAIATFNVRTFLIESCSVLPTKETKNAVENIKFHDDDSQIFLAFNGNKITMIHEQALHKWKFEKSITMMEFENWLKEKDVPAKIMKVFLTNEEY